MYLATVEIENFRSHKHLHVDLQNGLNVLVGRNNTGKTNLLDAIRIALGPDPSRGDVLWLEHEDLHKEGPESASAAMISITLTFAGLTPEQRSFFFEIIDFNLEDPNQSKAVIRFEASWSGGRSRALVKRTGGRQVADASEVPAIVLAALPVTFLPALRDAEAALSPGRRSRLAFLLRDLAKRRAAGEAEEIESIYKTANEALEAQPLISSTRESIQVTTKKIAGTDDVESTISVADSDIERILRTLQIRMPGSPVGTLNANGLGYNNLLYMAVVLEHLKNPDPDACPLLLIEEPEAHLHPQLTMLLAEFLATDTPAGASPQTIVTTHSPTLAANVRPSQVSVLFTDRISGQYENYCSSLYRAGLNRREEDQLQRMLDVTRATLYFAKGVILVEGICEALLLPALARKLNLDLGQRHISVIPITGVAFGTFKKILRRDMLGIPIAIVTDSDPKIMNKDFWQLAAPEENAGKFIEAARMRKIREDFIEHETVIVFSSKVTLEYDLAEAGERNPELMTRVWESCFEGRPGTLNQNLLAAAGPERKSRALAVWRGICIADPEVTKAEFAHRLASAIDGRESIDGIADFVVPHYLERAIISVVERTQSSVLISAEDGT